MVLCDFFVFDWLFVELGFVWLVGELDGVGVVELDCC